MTTLTRASGKVDLRLAGLLVVAAYLVAAWKLTALSWDGSWYLFRSLRDQAPFSPHTRFGTYPVLFAVVQASRFINDTRALGMLYGGLLALLPVVSLAVSWYYLKGERLNRMRIWPTLGILLAALPGQLCLMSEGTLVAQLLWPILILVLTGPATLPAAIWLILLAVLAGLLHPTSILIFGLTAALFGWRAWQQPRERSRDVGWLLAFAALAIAKSLLTWRFATTYERGQVAVAKVSEELIGSLLGYPGILLGLTYLLGYTLMRRSLLVQTRQNERARLAACSVLGGALLAVGVCWAVDPNGLHGLLDYRRFVLPAMLPLLGMAGYELRGRSKQVQPPAKNPAMLLTGVAAIFFVVLTIQSFVWGSLTDRFYTEVATSTTHELLVPGEELPWIRRTPLDHWTAASLSILLQGRTPRAVFVTTAADIHAKSVQVNPWEEIRLDDGWFTLAPLRPVHSAPR